MEYKLLSDIDFKSNIDHRVFAVFLAKEVNILPQKNGQQFISVTMKYKNIEINAKKFGATQDDIDSIKAGKVYQAAIDVKKYDKSETGWACIIYNIEENETMNINSFIEWADGMTEAQQTINDTLNIINSSIYKDIVYPIVVDKWNKFAVWTAASGVHHNILGGLFVHTAEVIDICKEQSLYWNKKYGDKFINTELLLASAILHDICKVDELDVDTATGGTKYSIHASLSTHIMDILSEVDIQAYKIKFGRQYDNTDLNENIQLKTEEQIIKEKEALELLKHCLAAHHGKLEYGSPIVDSIPEAFILNKADELSAEMFKYNKDYKQLESGNSSHNWSPSGINVIYKEKNK